MTGGALAGRVALAGLCLTTLLLGCDRRARAKDEQAAAERSRTAAAAQALRGDTVVKLARPLAMAAVARRLARESYRLRWYDAQQGFVEVAASDTGPDVRFEFRALAGDSAAIVVLDSAGRPGNGRGVPVARRIAWAAIAAASLDSAATARDAGVMLHDTLWVTQRDGRETMCRRARPPDRWVIADTRHDPSRCLIDRLFGSHYNVSVLERSDSLAVGAILTACLGSPVPRGWVSNLAIVDLDRCPPEPGGRREQVNVVVFKSPPRADLQPRTRPAR